MLKVRRGDVVFHLCGASGKAAFTGFSTAADDGARADSAPSGPNEIYRVTLRDYTPFEKEISWKNALSNQHDQLQRYFLENKVKGRSTKERLFYVLQGGKLQCLNGAYLSYLSDQLTDILFGIKDRSSFEEAWVVSEEASASSAYRVAAFRIGQQEFSENVKKNFANTCCFPTCNIDHPRFLVGAHIARWADVEESRGRTDNGLCLCVLHDRAFEIGAFTLDSEFKVRILHCDRVSSWVKNHLIVGENGSIKTSTIKPALSALKHHWAKHQVTW